MSTDQVPEPPWIREYVYSLPGTEGMRITIPCINGKKWPPAEEFSDMITFLELIIKQLRRGQAEALVSAEPQPAARGGGA
jgi:hypothetical protein